MPLYRIVETHALLDSGTFTSGIWLPAKKEAYFDMTIRNSTNSFTRKLVSRIPIYSYNWRYSSIYSWDTVAVDTNCFSGHSFTQWKDSTTWKAYDMKGNTLSSYNYKPYTIELPQDTFVAKLWAGTNNPVAEGGYELNRGARFGIVDAQYSLLALESDTLPFEQRTSLADKGVPFLSDDDIFVSEAKTSPVKHSQIKNMRTKFSFVISKNGWLKIMLPSQCIVENIKVFDLRGRVVLNIPKNELQNRSVIQCNIAFFAKGTYQIVLNTSNGIITKTFSIL